MLEKHDKAAATKRLTAAGWRKNLRNDFSLSHDEKHPDKGAVR